MKLIENFNQIPPLEFMSATQFVIMIWNRADIVRSITQAINHADNVVELNEIDARVQEILRKIEYVPTILKEDLEYIIIPIGKHIKAMRMVTNFSPYLESFHREFTVDKWTTYGTVDINQINKKLVQDSRRAAGFRYQLACYDCFEENVCQIFHLLSREDMLRMLQIRHTDMRFYWTLKYVLIYERSTTEKKDTFKLTLVNGSKFGIEYFMNTLERQDCLDIIRENLNYLLQLRVFDDAIPLRRDEHYSDALYFLLSMLVEWNELNVVSTYFYDILHKFLSYPFFGLFYTYREDWLRNRSSDQIISILSKIAQLKALRTHFFGYELFDDIWFNLTDDERQHIIMTSRDHALIEEIRQAVMRQVSVYRS